MSDRSDISLSVSALSFRGADEVLLVKRANAPALGLWTLPGGRLEFGETLAGAVARELLEETGLVASTVGEINGVFEYVRERRHDVVVCFDVEIAGDREPTAASDAADARWARLSALGRLDTTTGLADLVRGRAAMRAIGQ